MAIIFVSIMLMTIGGVFLIACNNDNASGSDVYLITMDSLDEHWRRVNAGAKSIADEEKISFTWQNPSTASDAALQSELVRQATNNGAKVIMLASANAAGTKLAVEDAMDKGVKFIYVDSPSDASGAVQTLATDNINAGTEAAKELLLRLEQQGIEITADGQVWAFRPDTSTSTEQRRAGFVAEMERVTGFKVDVTVNDAKDPDTAKTRANTAIADGAKVLFGTNEGSTIGIGEAIADTNKSVVGAGFDVSSAITTSIRNGNILFTMQQNPTRMGTEGMKTAIQILKNKDYTPEEAKIDTGVTVYDNTNLETRTNTIPLNYILPLQSKRA